MCIRDSSQTEGYVPVTTSAQESPEYQDYLARAGEDNDTYYQVKIDAAKLLLDLSIIHILYSTTPISSRRWRTPLCW